ncbi:uncharacterized protein [Hoplias malabaricus]|uniref:uncharacterized protein n=1 Tax=Hoplias malabaricus TaxID=27720 RepID=UPI0034618AE2
MVRCGVLTGLVLLSLLSVAVSVDINIQTLKSIINHLQTNYGSGADQFAVAINVPAAKCAADAVPDQNFLPDDVSQTVKAAMNSVVKVYKGQQLIGAKPKPINQTTNNYHSEYLLLIKRNPPDPSPDDPLIKQLLDKDPNGCVVFYTYNSPCVQSCSTPGKPHSIIPAFNLFSQHHGPKAFVFHQVWAPDVNSQLWKANIKSMNNYLTVYRCNNAVCTRCVNNNGNVNDVCMH